MAAPTFIQEAETAWNSTTTPKTTASFTVQTNDVLVAITVKENYNSVSDNHTIAVSGGSLTWTNRQTVQVAEYTWVALWTAIVDSNKSMTVTFTRSGTSGSANFYGGNVLTFRGSDGVGASNKNNADNAGPSLSLTTTQANSAVVVVNGDWNATDGTSRTWRTVNSITPTAGNSLEVSYFRNTTNYATYGAYWSDVGSAGAQTYGISSPSTQKYSIAGVEVKGTAGGGPTGPPLGGLTLLGVGR